MERAVVQKLGANLHGANGHAYDLLDAVEATRLDHAGDTRRTTDARKNQRPAWWLLYIAVPLTALLFLLADRLSASSGWRTGSEMLATLIGLSAIGLWLRANRMALIMTEYFDHSEGPSEMC